MEGPAVRKRTRINRSYTRALRLAGAKACVEERQQQEWTPQIHRQGHLRKPSALPEDSSSPTVPGMIRYASGYFAPFPLTLPLSLRELREREQRALRSGRARCLDCSPHREGFTLSPRERAGVRGNRPRHGAAGMSSTGRAADAAGLFGFEPFTISKASGLARGL